MLSHTAAYGGDVTAEPIFLPPIMNWTFATATLSEVVAVKVTSEPDTVAPLEGAVKETDGGVLSAVILGVVDAEVLSSTVSRTPPGVADRELLSRVPLGATDTVIWMVDLPRFLLTTPNTAIENEFCP